VKDHYSYTLYADPATARTFDDRRFGGPIGELVAREQAGVLARFLDPIAGRTIVDVGTGTGRAALQLAQAGAHVTGIDASEQMLAVARQRAAAAATAVNFQIGDAHALPFPDRNFDAAVCLRVLMHTPDWRHSVAELCRVADRFVVADFPSAASVALVQALWRRALHAAGVRTEAYRVFSRGEIARAFRTGGFRIRGIHRQFVLPIALHKAIGSLRFTETSERALAAVGLLAVFGSPVTIVAERCESS